MVCVSVCVCVRERIWAHLGEGGVYVSVYIIGSICGCCGGYM